MYNACKKMYRSNTFSKIESLRIKSEWIMALLAISIMLGVYINLFSYFALLVAVASVFLLSDEDMLCLLMFLMPFANVFKGSPSSQSFFTYMVLFYVLYKLVISRSFDKKFFVPFVIFVTFLVCQLLISVHILRTIKFLANILLIYYALLITPKQEGKKVYISYIAGILLSSCIVALNIFPEIEKYTTMKELGGQGVDLIRFSGMYGDPNYYSVNLIISLCLVVILHHKKYLSAVPSLILAVIMTAFAIMTYSKSAFLMLFLPLIMLLYSKIKSRKYFTLLILIIIGIVFVFGVVVGNIDFLDIILLRFSKADDLSSLTTSRSDIWKNYIKVFIEEPLPLIFGRGFGADLANKAAAHNTYIDLIYYLGIVETIILLMIIFALAKLNRNRAKKSFLNYSVILCVVMMYFFLSELFYFDCPFHIILAISTLNLNNNTEISGDDNICLSRELIK